MKDTQGWVLAVVAGLLTGALVVVLDPFAPGPPPEPVPEGQLPTGPLARSMTPFASLVAPADLVFVADAGDLPRNGTGQAGQGLVYQLHNGTSFITLAHVEPAPDSCQGPCGLGLETVEPAGSAIGEGHMQARLSVYVFDDVGSLLATNVADGRFGPPSVRLPNGTWDFSSTPAPGTTGVRTVADGLLQPYADRLIGATAETVQSARLGQHPYAWLVGPIYVTVRVDAVLPG